MIEELAQQLSDIELAISVKTASMGRATKGTDQKIAELEHDLEVLREHRVGVAAPFVIGIADDERQIDEIKAQIIDEWTGEHKTMVFDAGTLKFRTSKKLVVHNDSLMLEDLIDNLPTPGYIMRYLKGFNLTKLKEYMKTYPQQPDVAELVETTTVKLEQESG